MRELLALVALVLFMPGALTGDETDEAIGFALSDDTIDPVLTSLGGGGDCDCDTGCDGGCDSFEPWRFLPTLPCGVTITGWIEAGATASADRIPSRYVRPVTFNDRQDAVVNQLYAVIERSIDTSCGWDVGGRIDLLYGTDRRFTEVRGLELERDGSDSKWNGHSLYGLSVPQMYAEFGFGNLSAKVGHWYTTIGYEVVTAPDNFFYSHAYTMAYGEPFTHTGILATYEVCDRASFYGAVHNGWDNFDSSTERASFLTGVNWTSLDDRTSIAFAVTTGDEINSRSVYSERTMYSAVFSHLLNDRLEYVLQHDHAWQTDDGGTGVDAEWYGVNQYLMYSINDCWKMGTRLEWFRDDDGVRVPNWRGSTGLAGSYWEATAGLNWMVNDNVTIRPEVRWDWFDGAGNPYSDGRSDDQFTAAFDAILLF